MMKLTRSMIFCGLLVAWPALAQPPQTTFSHKKETRTELPTLPTISWKELSAQIGGPTLVTLSAVKMLGSDAIDALAAQSPIAMQTQSRESWADGKKLLTADYQAQPFWSVTLDMAQQLEASVSDFGRRGLFISPYREQRGLMTRSGPSLFRLQRINYLRTVEPGSDQKATELLDLNGTLYKDPKLQWQSSASFLQWSEASDESGQSLLLDKIWGLDKSSVNNFKLQLKPPLERGGKLKYLRGSFHGVVAAQTVKWEVPQVLQAKNIEKILKTGDTTTRIEVQDVIKEEYGYVATIVISQSGDRGPTVMQLADGQHIYLEDWSGDGLSLLDTKDRALQIGSWEVQRDGNEQTRITTLRVTFEPNRNGDQNQNSSPPAKLVLRYAWDWRELVVPFEFTNVILP